MNKSRLFILLLLLTVLASLSGTQFGLFKGAFPILGTANVSITIGEQDSLDPTLLPLLGVISGPDPVATQGTKLDLTATGSLKLPGISDVNTSSVVQESSGPNVTLQYQDIGVNSIRNNDYFDDRLDMELMFNCGGDTYPSWECDAADPENYNWTTSDAQFQSYVDGGFEPLFRLGGEWENGLNQHDYKGPRSNEEENWIDAALVVTDRYLHWNSADSTFKYGDIWTEFPGVQFWDRTDEEFYNFWLNSYVRLKEAYPDVKWGGLGFAASVTSQVLNGDGGQAKEFLIESYSRGVKPDWLGFHFFSNEVARTGAMAQAYRDLLNAEGDYAGIGLPWEEDHFFEGVELIVDAYGLTKYEGLSELSEADKNTLYNGAMGASILTGHWIALQYSDVVQAYYYRGNDLGEEESLSGLFHADAEGSYKPSARAFKLWSTAVKNYPNLLDVTLTSYELSVLAASNEAGERMVLISNPTENDLTWKVTNRSKNVGYYQVDEINTGDQLIETSKQVITIPAHSVQLVNIGLPIKKPITKPILDQDTTGDVSTDGDVDTENPDTPLADTPATVPTDTEVPADTVVATPSSSGSGGGGGGSSNQNSEDEEVEEVSENEDCESDFTDLSGHWGQTYIDELFCQGVIEGKTHLIFDPNAPATRAELLKIAYLSTRKDLDESASEPFVDVGSTDWFQELVASAYEDGSIEGYSDGKFHPNDYVNRAEALTIFMRVFEEEPSGVGSLPYSDVSVYDWFAPSVSKATSAGVIEGYDNGTYRPENKITRAEVAAIAIRMQEVYE